MNRFDPKYSHEQLQQLCVEYKRKSAVMREICDHRHDNSMKRSYIRDSLTVTASALFLGLNFFGSTNVAAIFNIPDSYAAIAMSIATFLLLASSIWQISADRTSAFQNYRGIQDFATITNKIDYIIGGADLDEEAATYWAREITAMYEGAARDIPRITDKEHAAAKKRLG